jgi:hypothetical protein
MDTTNNTATQPEAPKTREKILQMSLDAREQEVMMYQINIDNYTAALNRISKLSPQEQAELSDFANQLAGLLAGEKLEQKKAKIMLYVVKEQLMGD